MVGNNTRMTTRNGGPCHLLSIPPELRLRIYEYLYDNEKDRRCSLILRNNKFIECFQIPCFGCEGAAALLRTCKEIYYEATPVLYENTTFKILVFGHNKPEFSTLHSLAPVQTCTSLLKQVRRLSLNVYLREKQDMDPAILRLTRLLQQFPTDRKLKSCSATIVLCSSLRGSHELNRELSAAFLRTVLDLERNPILPGSNLSKVSADVYHEIWKDTVRLMRRFNAEF